MKSQILQIKRNHRKLTKKNQHNLREKYWSGFSYLVISQFLCCYHLQNLTFLNIFVSPRIREERKIFSFIVKYISDMLSFSKVYIKSVLKSEGFCNYCCVFKCTSNSSARWHFLYFVSYLKFGSTNLRLRWHSLGRFRGKSGSK